MSEVLYEPSEWQATFHGLDHHEALGAGAAGPGKSLCLLMDPLTQIRIEHERCANPKHPYHIAWGTSKGWALHLRRTTPMLRETLKRAAEYFPVLDPGVKRMGDADAPTYRFSSGYLYQFGHCKDPGDWQQYHSNQYTYIGFDELTQFLEEQYDQIGTRLRVSDPILRHMLKIRSMSNPVMLYGDETFTVRDPHWVRRRFVDPCPDGNTTLKRFVKTKSGGYWRRWIYLPATLDHNPDPEFRRLYEENLAAKPPLIRQAMLYGNWYVTEGSFYGAVWDARLHICKPFKIPDDWRKFRSMDWGYKAPGVVGWWAMDPDNTLYLYREVTFRDKSDVQVANIIKEIEVAEGIWGKKRSTITGPADTQLWENRGEARKSKAEVFHSLGVPWLPASKNRKADGTGGRVGNAERLLFRLQDHDNGTKTPGIVFFNTCKMTIKTLPAIQTRQGCVEEPQDGGEDHWHDMVLYAMPFASRGYKGIPDLRDQEDDDDDEDDKPREPKGRYVGYGVYV